MAMIDYGAIAFKNGKLISTDMFTPMIDMVGWEDNENDTYHDFQTDTDKPLKLNGNYFAYIGDSDCTVAFYKTVMRIVEKVGGEFFNSTEYLTSTYYTWSKWTRWLGVDCGNIKVTKRNGYLVCRWKYKGDKYKVYFGYGVDLGSYQKWRIVNYYRCPAYRCYQIKCWFDDLKYEIKYRKNPW